MIDTAVRGTSPLPKIEAAISNAVSASSFPKISYGCDPNDKYVSLIDYTVDERPGSILLVNQSRIYSPSGQSAKQGLRPSGISSQTVQVVVAWSCAVDTTYFEQDLARNPILIPAEEDAQGQIIQPQMTLRIERVSIHQPPRKQPETGTRADITFRVETNRY